MPSLFLLLKGVLCRIEAGKGLEFFTGQCFQSLVVTLIPYDDNIAGKALPKLTSDVRRRRGAHQTRKMPLSLASNTSHLSVQCSHCPSRRFDFQNRDAVKRIASRCREPSGLQNPCTIPAGQDRSDLSPCFAGSGKGRSHECREILLLIKGFAKLKGFVHFNGHLRWCRLSSLELELRNLIY